MWMATGMVGIAVQPLPGTDHSHTGWVIALGTAIVWGAKRERRRREALTAAV
jgi:hypothetical protein